MVEKKDMKKVEWMGWQMAGIKGAVMDAQKEPTMDIEMADQ